MPDLRSLPLVALCLLCLPCAEGASPSATPSRSFRCAGSNGTIILRDVPCTTALPADPSTSSAPASPAIRSARSAASGPRPLQYLCTSESGEVYASRDGQGNPRWISADTGVWVDAARPSAPPHAAPEGLWASITTEQWVRDSCQPASPQMSCAWLLQQRHAQVNQQRHADPAGYAQLEVQKQGIDDALERGQCP